jgi:hypothetical protein
MDEARFAKLLGVDARSVKRWEAGTTTPTGSAEAVMDGLCEALDRAYDEDALVRFVTGASQVGGFAYLLVKLFEQQQTRL